MSYPEEPDRTMAMEKLDYESPGHSNDKPKELEYGHGCFPGLSACFCAVFQPFFGINALHSVGIERVVSAILTLLFTTVAWLFVIVMLRRPYGIVFGVIAGLIVLTTTLVTLGAALQLI